MPGDHLKRLALQIAAQLPENDAEALQVLEIARGLVRHLSETTPWQAAVIRLSVERRNPGSAQATELADQNEPQGKSSLA